MAKMDFRQLAEQVARLLARADFLGAEKLLLEARRTAEMQEDLEARQFVLSELIELYCVMEPPRLAEAEALSRERQHLKPSAYSTLQTAMILQHGANDPVRAIPELEAALRQARAENDDKTAYMALSLLGQAYLETNEIEKASSLLSELEAMVISKASFVVGDETPFLEGLRTRDLETKRVSRLASSLVSACRDPEFKKRLSRLSG